MKIIDCVSTRNLTQKKNRKIKYIVIHYTAGVTSKSGSAKNTANYFASTANNVSSDFIVDDESVVRYNENIESFYSWHCGGNKYSTSGGLLYKICTNSNSIGIEICSVNSTGKMQNANDKTYSFTEKAVNNAIELTKYLMKKYNIPKENVIRHYDVTGKPCPGIIGWNKESGSEAKWNEFKSSLSDKKLYRIQFGAFSDKDNAENYLKEVQKVFPEAIIRKDS